MPLSFGQWKGFDDNQFFYLVDFFSTCLMGAFLIVESYDGRRLGLNWPFAKPFCPFCPPFWLNWLNLFGMLPPPPCWSKPSPPGKPPGNPPPNEPPWCGRPIIPVGPLKSIQFDYFENFLLYLLTPGQLKCHWLGFQQDNSLHSHQTESHPQSLLVLQSRPRNQVVLDFVPVDLRTVLRIDSAEV